MGMALEDVFQNDEPVQEGLRDLAMAAPMLGVLAGGTVATVHDALTNDQQQTQQHSADGSHFHQGHADMIGHRHMDTLKTPDQIQHHQEVHQDAVHQHSGDKAANPNPRRRAPVIETGPVGMEAIARQITDGEGSRQWVYDDKTSKRLRPGAVAKGNRTVGIGFNMDQGSALRYWVAAGGDRDDFQPVRLGRQRIDPSLAQQLLRTGIERARRQVKRVIPDLDELPQPAQLVLIDMAYNMGSLTGFNGMVRAANRGDWDRAAEEMKYIRPGREGLTPWFQQTGQRAQRLYRMMKRLARDVAASDDEQALEVNEALGAYSAGMSGGANRHIKAGPSAPKKSLDPVDPATALPKTERALERLYLDKSQGKWAHMADPRITIAMARPKRVYRVHVDGKHVGWIDFRDDKREYHKKGEWEEPVETLPKGREAELLAYLEKIQPKRRRVRESDGIDAWIHRLDADDPIREDLEVIEGLLDVFKRKKLDRNDPADAAEILIRQGKKKRGEDPYEYALAVAQHKALPYVLSKEKGESHDFWIEVLKQVRYKRKNAGVKAKPAKFKRILANESVTEAEDDDKKPTKADQAKVDAILKDSKLPEEAEKGKAYIVHWADGRGVFAVKKKSALQRWLNKVGSWAEIISIKYAEPVWGSKKTKLKVKSDINESVGGNKARSKRTKNIGVEFEFAKGDQNVWTQDLDALTDKINQYGGKVNAIPGNQGEELANRDDNNKGIDRKVHVGMDTTSGLGGRDGYEIGFPRIAATDANIKKIGKGMQALMSAAEEATTHDEAGIHIHFGLGGMFTNNNLLRLLLEVGSRTSDIERVALRSSNEWAEEMSFYVDDIVAAVHEAAKDNDLKKLWRSIQNAVDNIKSERYQFLNFTSMEGKGTIEFRIGSSELADDPSKFEHFAKAVRDMVDQSLASEWVEVNYDKFGGVDEATEFEQPFHKGAPLRFTIDPSRNSLILQEKVDGEWQQAASPHNIKAERVKDEIKDQKSYQKSVHATQQVKRNAVDVFMADPDKFFKGLTRALELAEEIGNLPFTATSTFKHIKDGWYRLNPRQQVAAVEFMEEGKAGDWTNKIQGITAVIWDAINQEAKIREEKFEEFLPGITKDITEPKASRQTYDWARKRADRDMDLFGTQAVPGQPEDVQRQREFRRKNRRDKKALARQKRDMLAQGPQRAPQMTTEALAEFEQSLVTEMASKTMRLVNHGETGNGTQVIPGWTKAAGTVPWRVQTKGPSHGTNSKDITADTVYIYWGGRMHAINADQLKNAGAVEFAVMNLSKAQRETLGFYLAVAAKLNASVKRPGSYQLKQNDNLWEKVSLVFGLPNKAPTPKEHPEIAKALTGGPVKAPKEVKKAQRKLRKLNIDWEEEDIVELQLGNPPDQELLQAIIALQQYGWIGPQYDYDRETGLMVFEITPRGRTETPAQGTRPI